MKRARLLAICLATLSLLAGGAAALPAPSSNPGLMAGVMTRWQTSSKTACQHSYHGYASQTSCPRSLMFSITPALDGLTLHDWAAALAAAGVTTGVIYVMPRDRIGVAPIIDNSQWIAYNNDIYAAPKSLTDSQKQTILQVGLAISQRHYSAAERDYAILTFLAQLQKAFPHGPPIRFVLDERVWFIQHLNDAGAPVPLALQDVFRLEDTYTADLSGIINRAVQSRLDQWIAGVRLSEYAARDWNLMGPVMVDLAVEMNAQTSGWMAAHLFIGAGGGWGQDWRGIDTMQCPATTGWRFQPCTGAFPFFKYLDHQLGYFAFGDKFMEFGKPQQYTLNGKPSGMLYTYINGEVLDFCAQNTRHYACDDKNAPSVKDWQAFLSDDIDGLGFSGLVRFMQAHAKAYPRFANVVFAGDNSDSVATMTRNTSANGGAALFAMFHNADQGRFIEVEAGTAITSSKFGNWRGKLFLDGFDDISSVPRPGFYGDGGYSLFSTDYNDFMFAPDHVQFFKNQRTAAAWADWP